jgi:hypothetical protein
MKIHNLSSKIHQMASTPSVVIVALLLIVTKRRTIPQKRLGEQRRTHCEALAQVLRRVLQPPTAK